MDLDDIDVFNKGAVILSFFENILTLLTKLTIFWTSKPSYRKPPL